MKSPCPICGGVCIAAYATRPIGRRKKVDYEGPITARVWCLYCEATTREVVHYNSDPSDRSIIKDAFGEAVVLWERGEIQ